MTLPSSSMQRTKPVSKVRGLVVAVLGVDETLQRLNATLDRIDDSLSEFNASMNRFNDALERIGDAVGGVDTLRSDLDDVVEGVAEVTRQLGQVVAGVDVVVGPARSIGDQLRRLGLRPSSGPRATGEAADLE